MRRASSDAGGADTELRGAGRRLAPKVPAPRSRGGGLNAVGAGLRAALDPDRGAPADREDSWLGPSLRLVPRATGGLQGDGVPDDEEHHLAVGGLVGPALHGAELRDVGGLAQRLLEVAPRGDVSRLLDDALLGAPG